VQAPPLGILIFLGFETIRPCGGIVNQLSEKDGAAGRQRFARPPKMQRRWVTMPDRLLARGGNVDRL
jgi:hypothetical protein